MRVGRRDIFAAACLVGLCAAVYWQVRSFGFVDLDDGLYVSRNPHVRAGLTWESVRWTFTNIHAGFWIPATWLSFLANVEFFGMNPAGFHLINLLLHAANSLLFFFLMSRWTGAFWRSAFVCALFAVHPMQVEAVAWVTQRKDVLCVFFGLASLACWIRWFHKPSLAKYLLVVFLYLASLTSKPMSVTMPWAWLFLDYWPFKRGHLGLRRLIWEKIPLLLISIFFAFLTLWTLRIAGFSASMDEFSFAVRLENAIISYAQAIGNIFWPSSLAVFYPHPGGSVPLWQTILTGFDLAMVSALVFMLRRRRPWLFVGWFGFLGVLFPMSGFFQSGLQASADRFSYLCIMGIFVMIIWEINELAVRTRWTDGVFAVTAVLVVLLFTWTSSRQTAYWKDSVTLFERALAVTSNNYVMHANLGETHLSRGELESALKHLARSIEIRPDHARAHFAMGNVLAAQGKPEQAAESYLKAIQLQSDSAQAHNNLGGILLRQGKTREALLHFRTAVMLWPEYADALNNLGLALLSDGQLIEARAMFERSIREFPKDPEMRNNLGIVLARQGDLPSAAAQFSRAISLSPNYSEARTNLHAVTAQMYDIALKKKARKNGPSI